MKITNNKTKIGSLRRSVRTKKVPRYLEDDDNKNDVNSAAVDDVELDIPYTYEDPINW